MKTDLHEAALARDMDRGLRIITWYPEDINRQDSDGNTALHFCAMRGDAAFTEMLLAHKANQHIQSKAGYTPRQIAKLLGHKNVMRTLDVGFNWLIRKATNCVRRMR